MATGKESSGGAGRKRTGIALIDDLLGLVERVGELREGLGELKEGLESRAGTREFELPGGGKGVFGFSVRVGLGGEEPVISEFGNVQMTEEGAVVSETREPLVDVFDEDDEILVVAELPGVSEDNIELAVTGDMLELAAEGHKQKFRKECLLPAEVDPESLDQAYDNGYLQVRLKKKAEEATTKEDATEDATSEGE